LFWQIQKIRGEMVRVDGIMQLKAYDLIEFHPADA
jgi:hypothetical protein